MSWYASMRGAALGLGGLALLVLVGGAGCVTPAEHEKLRVRVLDLERGEVGGDPARRERLAELRAEVQRQARQLEAMRGRIEVSEHKAEQALQEARAARAGASAAGAREPGLGEPAGAGQASPTPGREGPELPEGVSAEEVKAYREARDAWGKEDVQACIDRFRNFLQTYPDSPYADDAAYWMGDCYFKARDYRQAALRFDDVVRNYPTGNKAADALYRQGEALSRLSFDKAARTAFERLLQEYPNSARVPEARRQLELLGAG